ncbi:ABC transporter permease [Candidatus Halobonum tyrrellensis]|uniref:Binding-protein-dependent transport systems inner membrane component n=1 Tax=Candidatus Halobonum tyrrellensis G22 TaxID=1324957 RepID=V4J1U8_9EURY|nr:ABC transporter permease [Candidatus Halobonum tyrrellensis]ESP89397.1 binding-protein-dependent transport systems inner membrane component [Candidatus Halobonum tyrrellensis G22]
MAKRIVVSYLTLLVIMSLLFVLLRSMPGSFITSMINPQMTREQIERIRETWGLNEPLWRQYVQFMINYQTGDFGRSPTYSTAVSELMLRRLPRTLILFGSTFIVGYIVGPLVGMYLGWWRGSNKDKSIFSSSLLMYSMPSFWIAWLFIWLFNYHLGWLPSSYMFTQFPEFEWTAFTVMRDVLYHLALPLLSVSFIGWVGAMLIMRPSMNNVTEEGYVFLARAKGLSERTVMLKHAARNALIPVATGAIVGLAFIIDGAVVIENVFSWPGMGQLIVNAVLSRDFPVAQAAFFVIAALIVVMRLFTDVVYTYLDPRIKFGEGE